MYNVKHIIIKHSDQSVHNVNNVYDLLVIRDIIIYLIWKYEVINNHM